MKLGEALVAKGWITRGQLRVALVEQKSKPNLRLGEIFLNLGFIDESQHQHIIQLIGGHEAVDLSRVEPDPKALSAISENFAKTHNVLPVKLDNGVLHIACSDPDNLPLLEKVRQEVAGKADRIKCMAAPPDAIKEQVNTFYFINQDVEKLLDEVADIDINDEDLQNDTQAHPYIKLTSAILMEAFSKGASDIHMTPSRSYTTIQYRIDGVLREAHLVPRKSWEHVLARLKIEARLDISEKRKPQDGRIEKRVGRKLISFRVSTLPVAHGENVVLRILDQSKAIVPLGKLGLDERDHATLKIMLAKPVGIILVTGPTGSGKTTTLYSMLNEVNDGKTNIMTLEDPIEYIMPGIRQTQINEKAGMTFAEGIRTLLRQDPDRILIGEIRDSETAVMAMRAAITGHQVFATLHANSAIGALPRLVDMGVEENVLAGNVIGVIAQRLSRRLCEHCKVAYKPDELERELIGVPENEELTVFKASEHGCEHCDHTGYKGRVAIMEALRFNRTMDEAVLAGRNWKEIEEIGRKETGFRSMIDSAREKIKEGVISLDEAMRTVDFTEVL